MNPRPRIVVLSGPDVGLQRDVAAGDVVGRGDDCAVRLRDASVSRHHVRFEREGDAYTVVDLGSRNGLTVGGARVGRCTLTHGSEFTVGAVKIRFLEEPAADVEEITLGSPGEEAAAAPGGTRPRGPVEVGAARRRAIARQEGVLQFERIENAPESLLHDDLGQRPLVARVILTLAALGVAGALALGAFKLAARWTPEGGARPAEEAAGDER